jgi:hypothetical protein
MKNRFNFLGAVISCLFFINFAAHAQEKEVLGWQEKARIYPSDLILHAKLDSGADFSSLDASDVAQFEKGKDHWVRFSLANRYGKQTTLERPIRRFALIKRQDQKTQKRPVILLGICVGTSYMEEEVNLINRSKFSNQMLIGRSFLAGKVLVDPAVTYTTEPDCKGISTAKQETKEKKPQAEAGGEN